MGPRAGSLTFRVAAWVYVAGLLAWLTLGLLPTLVADIGPVTDEVRSLAAGNGAISGPATALLAPSMPMTGLTGVTLLQYAFSALNLVLGVLLLVRCRNQLVPGLLAVGLLGTAATFNLPSHEAFRLIGSPWPVSLAHFAFHVTSGVCYLWAVVLFADGRLPGRIGLSGRRLFAVALGVTAAVAAICWWSDFLLHPQFFVIFFGVLIPVAGVGAQTLRLRDPTISAQTRRSARLLIGALLPALAVAVLWCVAESLSLAGIAGVAATNVTAVLPDLFPAVFAIVPVVLFVALVRHRIFGLDLLLSRVLVATTLLLATSLTYLAVVVVGSWLAAGGRWWTVTVMAAFAVAARSAWDGVRRWVNRIVFGQDLDPETAMTTLVSGLELLGRNDELDQLVGVVVRSTRARQAHLWATQDDGWSPVVGAPAPADRAAPDLAGPHWWIVHENRRIGVLTIDLPPGEHLPAEQAEFLEELSEHAGLLLHNSTLADNLARQVLELADRTGQLQKTRRRMVAAQDRERFRLERNLHDGAQQTLVAAMIELRMAAGTPVPARTDALTGLRAELRASSDDLHQLASGGLPFALANADLRMGLDAVAQVARRAGLTVRLRAEFGDRSVDGWSDAAVATYFCCAESVQNALKYASASTILIEVRADESIIRFRVVDDGRGVDSASDALLGGIRGLDDRVAALGGQIMVESAQGQGTIVRGVIPLGAGDEPATVAPTSSRTGATGLV